MADKRTVRSDRASPIGIETSVTSPFRNLAIIGLGLIGSSIARAAREALPELRIAGFNADPAVRARAGELGLAEMAASAAEAVSNADLVILCVPVGAMAEAAAEIA